MGFGRTGINQPGLTVEVRTLFIEVLRSQMLLSVMGDAVTRPLGAPRKGAAISLAGARASKFRGIVGSQVRALLGGGDLLSAIRMRYPPLARNDGFHHPVRATTPPRRHPPHSPLHRSRSRQRPRPRPRSSPTRATWSRASRR